jgi:tRNA-Thr(GGU) m(6)t(6)A37 methyltransferase TsaA
MLERVVYEPIGIIRTPFEHPGEAPRQPAVARGAIGIIELVPGRGFEFALSDLDGWSHLWILYCFDRVESWRPRVRPPRSRKRRGVFATRSPHRPNAIGMSVVELVSIEGLRITVKNIDALDGTPVLDIKPYVAYTDALIETSDGWLASERRQDPGPSWDVTFGPLAERQAAFLLDRFRLDLKTPIADALALGPAPHPYRRIKLEGDGGLVAYKAWRAHFGVSGERVEVDSFATGYRAKELFGSDGPELDPHRIFVAEFGYPGYPHAPGMRRA